MIISLSLFWVLSLSNGIVQIVSNGTVEYSNVYSISKFGFYDMHIYGDDIIKILNNSSFKVVLIMKYSSKIKLNKISIDDSKSFDFITWSWWRWWCLI